MADMAITGLLHRLGFESPEAQAVARAVLEAESLTRPGRDNISLEKLERIQEVLATQLAAVCADSVCQAFLLVGPRRVVIVARPACEICAGSNNRRAMTALRARMGVRGVRRLLVVGGIPAGHNELGQLLAGGPTELRVVDGTAGNHNARMAQANMDWADLVVIWAGSSPLPHSVSDLYTIPLGRGAVVVHRRGIEALCEEILVRLSQ